MGNNFQLQYSCPPKEVACTILPEWVYNPNLETEKNLLIEIFGSKEEETKNKEKDPMLDNRRLTKEIK